MPADAAERDGEAARRLWSATLLQALADARHKEHREAVKSWLNSGDFVRLCDLAGVDPATARAAIVRELAAPVRERNEHAVGHAQSGRRRRKAPSS